MPRRDNIRTASVGAADFATSNNRIEEPSKKPVTTKIFRIMIGFPKRAIKRSATRPDTIETRAIPKSGAV